MRIICDKDIGTRKQMIAYGDTVACCNMGIISDKTIVSDDNPWRFTF
jgi:hypothetical protein